MKVGGVAVNQIQTWDFADKCDYDAEVKSASYETTSVYGFGHPLYYKNVIDVMRGTAEPETDGRAGLKSLEFLTAAYIAARDGGSSGYTSLLGEIVMKDFTVHETAIVDPGAQIGEGSRIWHWVHICSGASIGKMCHWDRMYSWVTKFK